MQTVIREAKERRVYCHDCGTANTVDSKYCKECGSKINEGFRTMMLSVQDLPVHHDEEDLARLTRLLDMAFWHNQAGNVDAAITASEAALAINPNSTTAHSLLGTLYEKRGNDEAAIAHFESVLALNPGSAADAAKLDQLRRGVHVKATAPPAALLWLPPAFVALAPKARQAWGAVSQTMARRDSRLAARPLVAAGAASLLVLGAGLLLVRPWARADAVVTYPVRTQTAPSPVTVARSAYGAEPEAATGPIKPVILPGSTTSAPSYAAPPFTSRDPFAGLAPAVPVTPSVWALPGVPVRPRAARQMGRSLPPLRLTALPPADAGPLPPAPVSVAALPSAPLATVDAVPQHTVVVNGFAGSSSSAVPYSTPDPPSHIRISVREARQSDVSAASAADAGGGDDSQAEADQQRALSLQESGDYKQARLAYGSAIRAYEARIASGRDTDAAARGLAACQTGLQICQQSQ